RLDPLPLAVRHTFLVPHEIGNSGLAAKREVHAKETARAPAGKHERGFAQRLAGNGAGVDARATDQRGFLHESDFFAEQSPDHRAAGSGGTATKDDEIEPGEVGRIHWV